jgi:hypothetical protein
MPSLVNEGYAVEGVWTGFYQSPSVFPCQHHSTATHVYHQRQFHHTATTAMFWYKLNLFRSELSSGLYCRVK